MRVGSDLQSKALLALEEVCAECRYCQPRRTQALRFALAYLWANSSGPATPFIDFWRHLAGWNDLHRWRLADEALARIYGAVNASTAQREAIVLDMWKRAQARHQAS